MSYSSSLFPLASSLFLLPSSLFHLLFSLFPLPQARMISSPLFLAMCTTQPFQSLDFPSLRCAPLRFLFPGNKDELYKYFLRSTSLTFGSTTNRLLFCGEAILIQSSDKWMKNETLRALVSNGIHFGEKRNFLELSPREISLKKDASRKMPPESCHFSSPHSPRQFTCPSPVALLERLLFLALCSTALQAWSNPRQRSAWGRASSRVPSRKRL